MGTIQSRLSEGGPIALPSEGNASDFPPGGDMEAEWPMFKRDIHNTGYTEAPRTAAWSRCVEIPHRPRLVC